jgi:hypothetical protein
MFEAGLAEMDMHVNEAGSDEESCGVDDSGACGSGYIQPNVANDSLFYKDIGHTVLTRGRVDYVAVLN